MKNFLRVEFGKWLLMHGWVVSFLLVFGDDGGESEGVIDSVNKA